MFEDADNEGVVALADPPGGRGALLGAGEVETEVLGRGSLHHLLLVSHYHLPADDMQLPNPEYYPAQPHREETCMS